MISTAKAFAGTMVAIACLGCERRSPARDFPLVVIDVASGRVVDEWEAPPLLFEVALDGERLWGVSGTNDVTRAGDDGGILWELSADAPPREVLRLPGIESGEMAIQRIHWNAYGAISIDSSRQRAVVSAPTSPSVLLVDLASESIVASYPVALQIHGTAVDSLRGIGYASSFDGVFSFDLLNGESVQEGICVDALSPAAISVATSANQVFVVASPHEVCRHFPDSGASEIVAMNCLHSPDCHLAGTRAFRADGAPERVEIAAPSSNDVPTLDTTGMQGYGPAMPLAPHDLDSAFGGLVRVRSAGLCRRIGIFEYNGESIVPSRSEVPIHGDALGLALADDGATVFVAQADPKGPLGIARWLEEARYVRCYDPILKDDD